ncbi:hypothetical protein [Mesorhizobium metallidurans]|uniref:hypothetical protein n=1 Tax=Mesorhizobium metallidurans TaxID=489722 RepID=UPI001FCBB0D0|nr:hypothetical protein [Mesorhizobium metallidurans]
MAPLKLPLRHAQPANPAHHFLLPGESGALALGYFRHGIVKQRVEQPGLGDQAAARIDLAIHRVMQAAAVGRRSRRHLVFRLRDLAVEPAAREFGVERLLLLFHLLVVLGDSGKLVAKTLHRRADRRSLRILH